MQSELPARGLKLYLQLPIRASPGLTPFQKGFPCRSWMPFSCRGARLHKPGRLLNRSTQLARGILTLCCLAARQEKDPNQNQRAHTRNDIQFSTAYATATPIRAPERDSQEFQIESLSASAYSGAG